ncbi:FAD-binding domain-containing protein [Sistotremastrum niveocremeum HHB9708]|uniref:D-lactate dehydrogenase (cytochrome) n=1 Tax=Sistotremastrum niveocremeum HHB9708 TaxID=1314777 RepID=A0A164XJM6_9AGAM|nr:FAD-binding domain-containing protein [Sistotremastrum niveocremeum HHB9708]
MLHLRSPRLLGLLGRYGSKSDFDNAIQELRAAFSDPHAVSTEAGTLLAHGFSMNDYHPGVPHTVVVFANSTEDVVQVVKIANKYKLPVVPFSGGTSLEGNFRAFPGGSICVSLAGMDNILEIHEADGDLVCQAGARWMDINAALKEKGIPLFFPLDPGPDATIGGMISTGCSGTNAVRYGTARAEWFLNVTVVLPSGEVIKTRRRARKSSAGFDLTKLFIGAEGTLGIVTEATLRLAPLLDTTVAICQFPTAARAVEAVREVLTSGAVLQCVELVDPDFIRASNLHGVSTRKYPEQDSIFFKFQGSDAIMKETSRQVRQIVQKYGATGWHLASNKQEASDLWDDRKNGLYTSLALIPGARGWSTDVCVPMSRLPEIIAETQLDIKEAGITSTIVGHVGQGNFHTLLLFRDDKELEVVRGLVHRMVERALALDGTCTGEHGVGLGKRKYLYEELGVGTVDLMKAIKKTIDPHNLFNPGKLYPDDISDQGKKL